MRWLLIPLGPIVGILLVLAVILVTSGCVETAGGVMRPVSTSVHDQKIADANSREMRFLGYSKDRETGYKEHLVGWRGPGTDPRKITVPFPFVVYDGQYRWNTTGIVGAPYRSRWGGWCWNYRYEVPVEGRINPKMYRAFACQHQDGKWYAYRSRAESPAR